MIRSVLRNDRGASAAEFALVLPILIMFLLGLIDAGRFMWEYNRAEKATQMGARYAVVTNMVPSGLVNYSFAVTDGIMAGTPVPTANFDRAVCNTNDCNTCTGSVCGSIGYDAAAFDAIVARMKLMYPLLDDTKVTVEYRNIGLGYSGDPNGPDVAPLVTVRLTGLTFHPLTMIFGGTISMPASDAALTLEDGSGVVAN
jgi:hypothetical protein